MVHYRSDDGVFDGNLDKVWRHNQAHSDTNTPKFHGDYTAAKTIESKGNVVVQDFTQKGPAGTFTSRVKMTMYPPVGYALEWLTGPFAGSHALQMYVAEGEKTRVILDGNFKGQSMDDATTLKMIDDALNRVFEDDNEHIRSMK